MNCHLDEKTQSRGCHLALTELMGIKKLLATGRALWSSSACFSIRTPGQVTGTEVESSAERLVWGPECDLWLSEAPHIPLSPGLSLLLQQVSPEVSPLLLDGTSQPLCLLYPALASVCTVLPPRSLSEADPRKTLSSGPQMST